MKCLPKEPLLQFIVAGVLIFAAHYWPRPATPDAGASAKQVPTGAEEVTWPIGTWVRQSNDEPRPDELRALVFSGPAMPSYSAGNGDVESVGGEL